LIQTFSFFLRIMSGPVLLHRQRSPEDLQQLLAWYKVRDMLVGQWQSNPSSSRREHIKNVVEVASVCEHPSAVWLTKLFAGRDDVSRKEARQVFLACENDSRALCLAGLLGRDVDEISRAADLGDAFAQAVMTQGTRGERRVRLAGKSAAQGERDGFYHLGNCYQDGTGCEKDEEKAKECFLEAAELGHASAMLRVGELLEIDDPQRFFWFGRAATSGGVWFGRDMPNRYSFSFLNEMSDQIHNFNNGTGHAKVVFAIGRALKGHIDNEKRRIFGSNYKFDIYIGPANQALHFYEFQLQSYRKAVDSWTIVGLRNRVVKDIRKMIGKMIWDKREEAKYSKKK
jgi:hypothetical protein